MLGVSRRQLVAMATVVLAIALAVWLAFDHLLPAPPKTITIAAGSKGGAYEFYAHKYRDVLARYGVTVEVRSTEGTVENLDLLKDPTSGVDIGFVQGGVSNASQAPDLESMGRINYLAFFIFCRAGETFADLTQLKGKRIAVGPAASGTNLAATKILKTNGITPQNATFLTLGGRAAVDALDAGKADVLFMGSVLEAPLIQNLLRDPGVAVVSLPRVKALVRRFAFLTRLELPSGVIDLERNIPSSDVTLIGTTSSVLVRADLHPEIVGLLARALVEVNGEPGIFQQFGEFPTNSDPEYPMAEGARDFYKNGPSFLHRYLPFWVTIYVRRLLAILVTVAAIAVPVFSYAPKVYLWLVRRHIVQLYRDLRAIEEGLAPDLSRSRLSAFAGELERIDRAASKLPMRHSDLFFALQTQIGLTRSHLDAALARPHLAAV
ncbi:MAG: ABC transporter substrate-binding protein [Reyranella sp.]|nr:ABC transporter substrate-binding protein [Reyranella sp.]MBL6650391.1 ABC transporter substrate-binding protein [Reyranella sp.]